MAAAIEITTTGSWGAFGGAGLLFGLMLVAAIIGGHLARLVHVPQVIGILLGGIVLRAVLDGLKIPSEELQQAFVPLKAIKDLALGLILFTIGGIFERSNLRAAGPRILKLSAAEILLSTLFVFAACAVASLTHSGPQPVSDKLLLALLLGLAAIATAPAATTFVLQEYESKGPATQAILALTGINNVVCIVLFHAVFLTLAYVGLIQAPDTLSEHLWAALLCVIVGSVVLGVACGTAMSIVHTKLPLPEALLIFFAMFLVLGSGEAWLMRNYGLSYNFLLTALVIGGIFANLAIDAQKLEAALRTIGAPIFAGFFVIAGYDLHMGELLHLGWIGAAYVVGRLAGKWLGVGVGMRWGGASPFTSPQLGTALLCQAAVVIGLASFVVHNWSSDLAKQFETIVLGSVVVFEFAGPILIKRCVVRAGEVKAITLLGRGRATGEGRSITRLTLGSLQRLLGLGDKNRAKAQAQMQVRHIMRTNVQFIRASDTFDAVLHFIERSTHSHFPVVDDEGLLVGVLHFNDVHDVIYEPSMSDLVTAVDLVDPDSDAVPMDLSLTALLDLFTSINLAVLPVIEEAGSRHVVGIVEQRDLLTALHLSRPPR